MGCRLEFNSKENKLDIFTTYYELSEERRVEARGIVLHAVQSKAKIIFHGLGESEEEIKITSKFEYFSLLERLKITKENKSLGLPPEVLLKILSFLSPKDSVTAGFLSRADRLKISQAEDDITLQEAFEDQIIHLMNTQSKTPDQLGLNDRQLEDILLRKGSRIHCLNLEDLYVKDSHTLHALIVHCPNLKTLGLRRHRISSQEVRWLSALIQLRSIRSLDLWRSGMTGEEIKNLLAPVPLAPPYEGLSFVGWGRVQSLNLGSNEIGLEGVKALAALEWKRLQSLNLESNTIGDEGAKVLAASEWKSLQSLYLEGNQIGDEGAKAIAALEWKSLQSLNLSNNTIGDEGAKVLAASEWKSLQSLDLGYNQIGDEGAKVLATSEWKSLQSLNLSSNKIGAEGAKALAGSEWKSLQSLDLGYNEIGDEGAGALAAKEWKSLRSLSLVGNQIGDEGFNALVASEWLRGVRTIVGLGKN